ncbi:hypothetical protein SRHO_G00161620 [Serrasalmus rhombeus]
MRPMARSCRGRRLRTVWPPGPTSTRSLCCPCVPTALMFPAVKQLLLFGCCLSVQDRPPKEHIPVIPCRQLSGSGTDAIGTASSLSVP